MTVKYWVRDEGFTDQVMKDTQKLSPYEIVDLFEEKERQIESLEESIPSCGEIDSLNDDVDNLEIKVGILEDELQQKG